MTGELKLWPFRVDWRGGVQVNLAYRTDIIMTESRREQRRALRTTPRRTLDFSVIADGARQRTFRALMASWQHKTFVVADPTRKVALAEAADAGDSMEVAAAQGWLTANAYVVAEAGERRELRQIEAITDTAITFTETSDAWPADTLLRPGLQGQLAPSLSASQPSSAVARGRISFHVTPASEPQVDAGATGTTLGGREVFTWQPNWRDGLSIDYDFPSEAVDYGRSVIEVSRPVDFGTQIFKAAFLAQDEAAIVALEQFFRRAKGRRGEFYMSSGLPDLVLADTAQADDVFLRVSGTEVAEAYAGDTVHRAIEILLTDRTRLYRKLAGEGAISEDEGDTIIEVTEAWGADIAPADVQRISWMPACRFAADSMTIDYLTDEVAQVQLAIQTLEDPPAE